MSLLFWRKKVNEYSGDEAAVAVTVENPLPVTLRDDEEAEPARTKIDMEYLPPVAGQTVTRMVQVPGIGTAAAYTDGDAFGTLITWTDVFRAEKCSGTIVGAFLIDKDDEGLQVDIPLFIRSFTTTTDNDAFAPTDADLMFCRGVVSINSFYNWNANQFGQATNVGLWVKGESPNLYSQLCARGAMNIAAGSVPWIALTILPD